MSTITDVAKAAGVSVATVSRALRGLDRVSPETRERVQRVATELNFVASPSATSLALGRTRVIAVVAPFLTRWFFATIVSSVERTLRQYEHHVLLFDLEDDSYDKRMHLNQNMLWKRVDGVITLNIPVEPDEVDLLDRLDLPVVAVGTSVPGRPLVSIDDRQAAALATQHLIDLGHTRIAYVGSVPETVAHVETPRERLSSFRDTMAAAGLDIPGDYIVPSEWTARAAAADIIPLLTGPNPPTAIVGGSDEMAIGVMQAARRLGIVVPDDLSVIGIDDFELSDVLDLTTVRQNVGAQGEAAAHLLMRMLNGDAVSPDLTEMVSIELIERASTAKPSNH